MDSPHPTAAERRTGPIPSSDEQVLAVCALIAAAPDMPLECADPVLRMILPNSTWAARMGLWFGPRDGADIARAVDHDGDCARERAYGQRLLRTVR